MKIKRLIVFMKTFVLFLFFFSTYFVAHTQMWCNTQQIDTLFYNSGGIKTITVTKHPYTLSSIGERKLIKTIYDYDECNHLRRTTNVYEVYVNPQLYGILNPSKYQREYKIIGAVECDKHWVPSF